MPGRYGLQYTINDTINVGGVLRGLRTIPVVLGIARDMEDLCPDAWFLNYTNPMAILIRAVAESSGIRTTGLCHSVYWTIDALAGYLDLPPSEIDYVTAGVNHLAWVLRLEQDGRDLYPALGPPSCRRVPDDVSCAPSSFRASGSTRPVIRAPRRVQPVVHPKDGLVARPHPDRRYLDRVANNLGVRGHQARLVPVSRSRSNAAASTPPSSRRAPPAGGGSSGT